MRTKTRIPLGKSDLIISEWWNTAIASGVNVSNVIVMCLDYYRMTGEFLHIADINCKDAEVKESMKVIYISESSDVYKWLDERQQRGEKVARLVKYVLRNSISDTNSVSEMVPKDLLYRSIEQLKYRPVRIALPDAPERIEENLVIPVQERAAEFTEPAVEETISNPDRQEEEEGDFDIFSALVGESGLHL